LKLFLSSQSAEVFVMSKKVLVPIADGIEEIEAVVIIDVLRRAEAEVIVASVGELGVTASRGVKLVADALIADCRDQVFDLIVLPGGMPGAENLRDSQTLQQMLIEQEKAGRLFGAICASPAVVLAHHGLLKNRQATCYPAFAEKLPHPCPDESSVVIDKNCITSRGPGTALAFALELLNQLFGEPTAQEIATAMLV